MEGLRGSQISEKILNWLVTTCKCFSWLEAWVQCLQPSTPWQVDQDLDAVPWSSKASHIDGFRPELGWSLLIVLLPQEGELWKTDFTTVTLILLPTLTNPKNCTDFQKFCRASSRLLVWSFFFWPFSPKKSESLLVKFWYCLHPRSAQAMRGRSAKWHIL